jgi:hypothetical protein
VHHSTRNQFLHPFVGFNKHSIATALSAGIAEAAQALIMGVIKEGPPRGGQAERLHAYQPARIATTSTTK